MTDVLSATPDTEIEETAEGIIHECCGRDLFIAWCGTPLVDIVDDEVEPNCAMCFYITDTSYCPRAKECDCRGLIKKHGNGS